MSAGISAATSSGSVAVEPAGSFPGRSSTVTLRRHLVEFFTWSFNAVRLWMVYDLCIAMIGTFMAFRLSPSFMFRFPSDVNPLHVSAAYSAVFLLVALAAGVYEPRSFNKRLATSLRVAAVAAVAWAIVLAAYYLFAYVMVGRWIVGLSACMSVAGATVPRVMLGAMSKQTRRRILVVGDNGEASVLSRLVGRVPGHGYIIVGTTRYSRPPENASDSRPASDRSLAQICKELHADVVVMPSDVATEAPSVLDDTVECLKRGIRVRDTVSFVEESFQKVPVELVGPAWLVSANLHVDSAYLATLKRGLDILAALAGLAITLPFWPFFALLVRLSGPGPILHRQVRVGRFGEPFTIYKFRTMCRHAESDGRARWATPGDPRVTAIGRFLRKTRIDELPQLWNILKGDMSLVGPRPERPEFVEELASKIAPYRWRHLVRPGLTGWAQICFRYGATEEDAREKLRYDLYYIKHLSPTLDLYVCMRTVTALLKGSW